METDHLFEFDDHHLNVFTRTINGKTEIRGIHSSHYFEQFIQPVVATSVSKNKRPHYQCDRCKYDQSGIDNWNFHQMYTHHGGLQCEFCRTVYFALRPYKEHKCKPIGKVLVDEENILHIRDGKSQWRVYAFILIRRGKAILWVGTTMCCSAEEAAKKALAQCEYAKGQNFIDANGRSIGCTSLIDLIHINDCWLALPHSAFFFDLPGGAEGPTKVLKSFVRRALKTSGHVKSRSCLKLLNSFHETIFQTLKADTRIPNFHKNKLDQFIKVFKEKYLLD